MNLRTLEHRSDRHYGPSTIVHPNGSLMVSSHEGLIIALMREVLKGAKRNG